MSPTVVFHIETRGEKCGGRPCIAGTRIRVQDIYVWHELQGRTPEDIVADFPQLSLADVHAAIVYYRDHRAEIEREMAVENAFATEMKERHPSKLEQKLKAADGDAYSLPS